MLSKRVDWQPLWRGRVWEGAFLTRTLYKSYEHPYINRGIQTNQADDQSVRMTSQILKRLRDQGRKDLPMTQLDEGSSSSNI
jgi:hypothetical protein